MNKIRLTLSALAVIAIVGSAFAFKGQNQKLWVCDTGSDKCIKQGDDDYQIGGTTFYPKAIITDIDLSTKTTCTDNCDDSFNAEIEP